LHDLKVDAEGVRALGHGLLALPIQSRSAPPLRVSLRWSLRALPVAEAATSFGSGREVTTVATAFDLAHAFYVAGPLTLRRGRQGDELVIWGKPGFDPDEALAICERALTTAHAMFETAPDGSLPPREMPHSFLFFSEPSLGGHHDGLAFHRSFGVWVDDHRPLDARVRVLVAHEIVHRWLGSRLRLNRPDGSDATWFSEGFTVHYARKLLRRAGLLNDEELADDMKRTLAAQRREIEERIAAGAPGSRPGYVLAAKPHPSAAYHRGALYAARLEVQLAERGSNLDELVRELMARAPERAAGLAESAWREAVEARLGPSAGDELDRLVIRAEEPIVIPGTDLE
jgi:predicted metalloprotease with PDZ domain